MNTLYLITIFSVLAAAVLSIVLIMASRTYKLNLQATKEAAEAERQSLLNQLSEAKSKAEVLAGDKNAADLAKTMAESDSKNAIKRVEELQQEKTSLEQEKKSLQDINTQLSSDLKAANATIREKIDAAAQAKKEREELDKKNEELIKEQIKTAATDAFRASRSDLNQSNQESIDKILAPIREQMGGLKNLMDETKSSNEQRTASLEGAMKAMLIQTAQLGKDATNLAEALKNKGKVHGDWGEQVLADILKGSGLIEGQQFVCQSSYPGPAGHELRPDVVVTNTDGSRMIVDSKVSLTAYADAIGAASDEEYETAVKANYDSVWNHVKELAEKDYPKYVPDSIKYVIMFVPNEGSYVMAMNYKPALIQEAFRKGIIIVNPTNLMITLFLIRQAWQNSRQEENCKKILEAAAGLVDKTMGVTDTLYTMGGQLDTVNKTFGDLTKQVSEGSGNLLRRAQGLKELGVVSTKRPKNRKAQEAVDLNAPLSSSAEMPVELPGTSAPAGNAVEDIDIPY